MVTEGIGEIRPVDIEDEMRNSYLDYAMSVIVQRALPDVRDHVARVEVGPEDIEALVSEGLLGLGKSANRREISKAIESLLLALSENAIDIVPEWFEYQNDDE